MKRSFPLGSIITPRLLFVAMLVLPAFASDPALEKIISKMDETAAKFRTAQANFTWTTFNSVVNEESGRQTGKIYFQRNGNETEMAAEIDPPDAQQVIFSHGKIQLYKSRTGIVDVYDASAHRDEFETFLVLGFGSSGDDMRKAFDVTYGGEEKIDGTDTAKLELVPKSDKMKQHIPQITLWINPQTGISVQQKLMETDGDYRLAKYSDIRLGQKIPAKVFQLKTSGKVKVVTH
jgi:outer membrane lipoprotein-sorting protein